MRIKKQLITLFFLFYMAASVFAETDFSTLQVPVRVIRDRGGRVDWSADGKTITFDRRGEDGYYDVYVMNSDGSDERCLTCDQPSGLPGRHNGNPAWHPSGRYIVFQSEKNIVPNKLDAVCSPGAGLLNDLWVVTSDGKKAYKIWNLPYRLRQALGTLHPQFSHDGRKLFWAERIGNGTITKPKSLYGKWVLKIADFTVEDGIPVLKDVREYHPGQQWDFYESHSFSPDDSKVLFSGNIEMGQPGWGLDIYEMDIRTGNVKNLTNTPYVWDEHAHYSPDGKEIVWMSNKGFNMAQGLRTEFWIMDSNGNNQRQLSHFNDPSHPHFLGKQKNFVAADSSFSPDGRKIVGLVNLFEGSRGNNDPDGLIVIIER